MRIGYWTTACLQPEIEAVSKEVLQLAQHFEHSFIFGVSSQYYFRVSRESRTVGFHRMADPVLRLFIPAIESICDISHVYGDPTPWTFYKALRSKPLVLTVASEKGLPRTDFIARSRKILVQTKSYFRKLRSLGVEENKLELLYPGVDLRKYYPRDRRAVDHDRPKILFASAPRTEEEMQNRGVYLLLEAARMSDDVQYHLLYRKWASGYTSLAATEAWLNKQCLKNVTLTNYAVQDMHCLYRKYDFIVIPYTTSDGGKECPTSALEGMACGVPTLISSVAPFSAFVDEHECGVVFDSTPVGLVSAIEIGMRRYQELAENALTAAQRIFSLDKMLGRMDEIYKSVLAL